MRKFVAAATLLAAAVPAVPAAAQYSARPDVRQEGIERRFEELRFVIDDGVRRGRIGREEAYSLHDELAHLRSLEALYRRGGLSGWERGDLQRRFVLLRDRIRYVESYGEREYDPRYDDRRDWDDRDVEDREWDEPAAPDAYGGRGAEPSEAWREEAPDTEADGRDWQDSAVPSGEGRQEEALSDDRPGAAGQDDNAWSDDDWESESSDEEESGTDWEYEPI